MLASYSGSSCFSGEKPGYKTTCSTHLVPCTALVHWCSVHVGQGEGGWGHLQGTVHLVAVKRLWFAPIHLLVLVAQINDLAKCYFHRFKVGGAWERG